MASAISSVVALAHLWTYLDPILLRKETLARILELYLSFKEKYKRSVSSWTSTKDRQRFTAPFVYDFTAG